MIAALIFLITLGILLLEGWLLAGFFIAASDRLLRMTFALPLAAISNVLLFLLFTIFSIRLLPIQLLIGHGVIIAATIFLAGRTLRSGSGQAPALHSLKSSEPAGRNVKSRWGPRPLYGNTRARFVKIVCILLLKNIFVFSLIHAVVLPTFSIDSFTNWTMRSKISYTDHAIAFDRDEARGMAKPQYPFLTHALQIAANEGQHSWSDTAANGITWLLSLSCFAALFLLLKRLRGTDVALIALTLIAGVPLLSIHLAQGYGDIHLVAYLLLALITCALWIEQKHTSYLVLSSLFIAGAMWTKSEGFFFGFAPWALLLLVSAVLQNKPYRHSVFAIIGSLLLFLPFPLLLLWKGLPLTPHGTDMSFVWHPEGIPALLPSVFGGGSFGILWYVLPVASVALLIAHRKKLPQIDSSLTQILLWGWLIVAENLIIYLFTPNVAFLIDGQSFFRQMLPAAALLILACALIIKPIHSSSHS
ncbi:glycosyltransferase family 39 protein [Candidatus Uhrbacteria bacterium]|nr:glycosyltransferase family 39 protein [Candidatus Uhrbacteria bacterium]